MSETHKKPLLERLRAFPKFGTMDGARWYQLDGVEPTCVEAADEIDRLERELQQARAAVKDFSVIAGLHDKPQSTITIRQGLEAWTQRHREAIDRARGE